MKAKKIAESKPVSFLSEVLTEFSQDKVMRWAAATAYYAVFSLAPLLVIAIAVAGVVFGEEAARGEIAHQLSATMGKEGAEAVQSMLQSTRERGGGILASLMSLGVLIFTATALFLTLEDGVINIMDVSEDEFSGMKKTLTNYATAVFSILGLGLLVLASIVLSTVLTQVSKFATGVLPETEVLLKVADFVIITCIMGFVFGAMIKYLPRAYVQIPWHVALRGGFVASVLFNLGKFLIAWYLSRKGAQSSYGAAGSLVLVMLWVYYSTTIFFLGAEVSKVYAKRHGEAPVADKTTRPDQRSSQMVEV